MFGRLHIRAPSGGEGKISTGQVTLLRSRTDDVRILLSTVSARDSQAYVATARASNSLGFSVDIVRANEKLAWIDSQLITVNWFAWPSDVEKVLMERERRGSTVLSNLTRIGDSIYRISFNPVLPSVPRSLVASARNQNRAQVLLVNIVGPLSESFATIKVKRVDDLGTLLEEDGTSVDWIATLGDFGDDSIAANRTGSGTSTRFSPSFPVVSQQIQRVFVALTVSIHSPDLPITAASLMDENIHGFALTRFLPMKRFETTSTGLSDATANENTIARSLSLGESNKVSFLAWSGLTDECEWEDQCSDRGSCLFPLSSAGEEDFSQFPTSTCACRSPFSSEACEYSCPVDDFSGLVCSGNGMCSQLVPECECFAGWTGELCSAKALSADSRFVFFVSLAIVVFVSSLCGFYFASRCQRRRSRERKLKDLRRALLGEDYTGSDGVPRERYEQMDTALNGDARTWAIPFEKLSIGAQIGHGSSSQVFVGLWASQTVAIKKIAVSRKQQKDRSLKTDASMQDVWLYFKREARFLSTLHHPNIVRFFGVASQQDYRVHGVVDYFYIVTELCMASLSDLIRGPVLRRPPRSSNTSLTDFSYLSNASSATAFFAPRGDSPSVSASNDSQYSVDDTAMADFVVSILRQICLGMDFLHSKGVVHRDLKCDNVLLDSFNRVKLCDFGISRVVDRSKGFIQGTTAMIATPAFMAPELIMSGTYPCGTRSDIFSFGIVLWSFIMWKEPYADLQDTLSVFDLLSRITTQGLRPQVGNKEWPDVLLGWYQRMVETDPAHRPTFGEILDAIDFKSSTEEKQGRGLDAEIKAAWLRTVVRTYGLANVQLSLTEGTLATSSV